MRILIANRGEIARRIIRTARRMGHETVAVYADPDRDAPHVAEADRAIRLGPADLAATYLSADRLLAAATESGATAVHPGYGFLSESAEFATAVVERDLTWIGPHPAAIMAMGDKIGARRIARDAGVPVIPGHDESQDRQSLQAAAERIGYPVLVKAAAGGGGKGIRVVESAEQFADALAAAQEESRRSFGDDRMIVERFVTRPRHIEVQVIGDRHGEVAQLGTRECSVQRRYQKLLEEAPAPNISDQTRLGMQAAAVTLATEIAYDSAGTVEFVVDDETGEFFFLEMNTRLQVEHPVTEFVTGQDLVELQLRAACGEKLSLSEVRLVGHAFEARINAEDASADFAPQAGIVTEVVVPSDVRWESSVVAGSVVTPHYDPLVAKLIVGGPDRETARRRLAVALDHLVIGGVKTNTGFHRWLIDQPAIVEGRVTTRFLDENAIPPAPDEAVAAAAAAVLWVGARETARDSTPWEALGGFRLTPARPVSSVHLAGREIHDIAIDSDSLDFSDGGSRPVGVVDVADRRVVTVVAGHSFTFRVLTPTERWSPAGAKTPAPAGAVVAPFPGVVVEVRVRPGDVVEAGQTVAVMEAMKMLHPLLAAGTGTVAEVRLGPGDPVSSSQVLVTFQPPTGELE